MPIRWDALLVHHLAGELDARLQGRRLRAVRLDGEERDLVLLFREETLVWRLHPSRGYLRFYPAQDPGPGDLPLSARVRGVTAPPDDRILHVELLPVRGRSRGWELTVELLGNQWNAVVTEAPDRRIRHLLRRREGSRPLAVGAVWSPPEPPGREGVEGPVHEETWETLAGLSPGEARRELVRRVAWTSPLNARHILGDPDGPRTAPGAAERFDALTPGADVQPTLLRLPQGLQPYPFPLADIPGEPCPSLLEALDAVAAQAESQEGAPPPLLPSELLRALEGAVDHALRRVTRLQAELEGLADAEGARGLGDLLLARYHQVPSGASDVVLDDFEGNPVRVTLDPALSVQENAARHYDEAARIERARERLPGLVEAAQRRAVELESLLARAREGTATAEEVQSALPRRGAARSKRTSEGGQTLPYHVFRSSGGLEIRVGRGAKHNDALTFHHSSPDDVWLHARHAAGAHVILRWPDPGMPPTRDLREAAVLAALNSRARTSGTVPVDWTLRKYVRKARGAAPGAVVPQRVKTVFVTPDPETAERLSTETA